MISIYADLNCPFCYALSEWVDDAGIADRVDWRLVDHSPQASFFSYSDQELIDLTEEIFTIRQRAPDLEILLPRGRCNVRNACQVLAWVKQQYPDQFFPLKRQIYRAYWAEDINIELLDFLYSTALDLGVAVPDIETLDYSPIEQWTKLWNQGPFDRRIPVMMHSDEQYHLGLPPKQETLRYLLNSDAEIVSQSSSCDYEVRPHLGVLGDWSEAWELIKILRIQYDLVFYADAETLQSRCKALGEPDLMLVSLSGDQEPLLILLEKIQVVLKPYAVPLLAIGETLSGVTEWDLYERGCTDVIVQKSIDLTLIKVRREMDVQKRLKKLLKNSLTDSLTQLQNRRSFISLLEKEWARASRTKQPFSLLMIDLDYFKKYNDHYGHLAGDGCLRRVASLVKSVLRKTDIACRYGGEEFIVILPETHVGGAVLVAESMMKEIEAEELSHEKSPFGVLTLSIGVTCHKYNSALSINQLIQAVDEQLYEAKASGRNAYKVKMFQ